MYIYQYICLAVFGCLLFNKETRFPAVMFIVGWAFYFMYMIIKPTPHIYYYVICATIETFIAYAINKRFRLVSYFGYSLIAVNFYGYYLFASELKPTYYDIIYAIITVTQVLLLIIRGLLDGVDRSNNHIFMVRMVDFDSGESRDTMYKNMAKKEKNP